MELLLVQDFHPNIFLEKILPFHIQPCIQPDDTVLILLGSSGSYPSLQKAKYYSSDGLVVLALSGGLVVLSFDSSDGLKNFLANSPDGLVVLHLDSASGIVVFGLDLPDGPVVLGLELMYVRVVVCLRLYAYHFRDTFLVVKLGE